MNKYYNDLILELKTPIPLNILSRIVLEMNKNYDKEFTVAVQELQKKENKIYNTSQRNILRKYYYYRENYILDSLGVKKFPSILLNNNTVQNSFRKTLERLKKYQSEKIINSIITRYNNYVNHSLVSKNSNRWLNYYKNKTLKESCFSLAVIRVTQLEYKKHNFKEDYIYERIRKLYKGLENYRNFIIIFDGDLKDSCDNIITWEVIYKVSLYCENFKQYKNDFYPFKKADCIKKLSSFIDKRFICSNSSELCTEFYNSISYGSKFEDLFISSDCKTKFLVFKKISLDVRKVPCPSCLTTIQSGNSFPEIFLKSWECKNPDCPDRSKSGRGKRFDEFGTYRFFKVEEADSRNAIDINLYKKWKRDIFDKNNSIIEMIIKYYSFAGETVAFDKSLNVPESYGRKNVIINYSKFDTDKGDILNYNNLPLIKFLHKICLLIKLKSGKRKLKNNIEVRCGNSSEILKEISLNQIGSAITSPPYYNAREYSQWPTLVHYLIDMMINAKNVYNVIDNKGTYLYNIGDIVAEDNIYVNSNMSKKRQQLGFLSAAIFEIVGFKLTGNIIWDKGEVQSKRNSTINLNAGYVRCINCYEHVLIFQKCLSKNIYDFISPFSPVIKINCKGENKYKHTAPYPLEMVDLIRQFIKPNKYVLDPFLGSGTTLVWCKKNGFKGFGIELNKEYYDLCVNNIFSKSSF